MATPLVALTTPETGDNDRSSSGAMVSPCPVAVSMSGARNRSVRSMRCHLLSPEASAFASCPGYVARSL